MFFDPYALPSDLQRKVDRFLSDNDLVKWYKMYSWENDSWVRGFPDILNLEISIIHAAQENKINKDHLLKIAKWGKLPNIRRISCPEYLELPIYNSGNPVEWIKGNPSRSIDILEPQVRGFGPTYTSKLLRFALPTEYGAIDSRLVRVFGFGDPKVKKEEFLKLEANSMKGRWYIPSQTPQWPAEYNTWIQILRYMRETLNTYGTECPHPPKFVARGLRNSGTWTCADVEMALFSYCSKYINSKK